MRKAYSRIALVVAGVIAAAAASPGEARAQDDCVELLECQWCHNATEEVVHKFADYGSNSNNDEYNPYHTNWEDGRCSGEHGTCYLGRLAEHSTSLNAMIASADAKGLARFAVSYPSQVRLNFSRAAVQLYGCGGVIVGHMPVSLKTLTAIELAILDDLNHVTAVGRFPLNPLATNPMPFAQYLALAN